MSSVPAGRGYRLATRSWDTLVFIGLAVFAGLWLIPFLTVLVTSVRSANDLATSGIFSIPREIQLSNFVEAWEVGGFDRYFTNSLFVTFLKVPLGILIASLAAYPLTKIPFRFNMLVFIFFLTGLTIPVHVALLPLFNLLRDMGILNTLWALFPPYIAFGLPFQILVLRGFFSLIPDGILDAARVDGASEFRIYWGIILPLSLPVLATLFIIDALNTWNELLIALVMLSSEDLRTVSLGLLNFQGQFSSEFTLLNAGIVIAILPILLVYILLQRYIVSGLTAGALKD